jgi:integrase
LNGPLKILGQSPWLAGEHPGRSTAAVQDSPSSSLWMTPLTLDETRALLAAATGRSERRIVYLAACAGLRCSELRLLQGLHFAREGWVLVSAEMAKGGRERWVPVMVDLEPIVREIRETTEADHYVLPATRWAQGDRGLVPVERPERPCDRKTIWRAVRRIGRRAGIGTTVHPHQLRHAFADRVTRLAGLHAAQALLGHASIQTTEGYLTKPSPDELVEAMARVTLGIAGPPLAAR